MTAKKNSGEQLITVDARKLSLGLKTAFEGVSMIFDSLGADVSFDVTEKEEVKSKKASASKIKGNTEPDQEEKDESTNAEPNGDDSAPDAADDSVSDDAVEETEEPAEAEKQNTEESAKQKEYVSSVTLDDVTKIIVQKIKKNRSNNEKIGQILKTYGVTKVGELDPKKYEAFLTDLGAL